MSLKDIQKSLEHEGSNLAAIRDQISAMIDGDGSGEGLTLSNLPIHQHFKIFRDYEEHEDDLINSRLQWNITIQGFLFATYGFSLQKLAEVQATGMGVFALRWLIFVLPIVGMSISVFSWKSIDAAQTAIRNLGAHWKRIVGTQNPQLPNLVGGGDPIDDKPGEEALNAHKRGFWAQTCFPWIFIVAWFVLFLIYGLSFFWHHFWSTRP